MIYKGGSGDKDGLDGTDNSFLKDGKIERGKNCWAKNNINKGTKVKMYTKVCLSDT